MLVLLINRGRPKGRELWAIPLNLCMLVIITVGDGLPLYICGKRNKWELTFDELLTHNGTRDDSLYHETKYYCSLFWLLHNNHGVLIFGNSTFFCSQWWLVWRKTQWKYWNISKIIRQGHIIIYETFSCHKHYEVSVFFVCIYRGFYEHAQWDNFIINRFLKLFSPHYVTRRNWFFRELSSIAWQPDCLCPGLKGQMSAKTKVYATMWCRGYFWGESRSELVSLLISYGGYRGTHENV